jgi:hypothetical protein
MDVEITIDDPKTYTRPWAVTEQLTLMPDTEILEYMCTENNRYFRLVPNAAPPGAMQRDGRIFLLGDALLQQGKHAEALPGGGNALDVVLFVNGIPLVFMLMGPLMVVGSFYVITGTVSWSALALSLCGESTPRRRGSARSTPVRAGGGLRPLARLLELRPGHLATVGLGLGGCNRGRRIGRERRGREKCGCGGECAGQGGRPGPEGHR